MSKEKRLHSNDFARLLSLTIQCGAISLNRQEKVGKICRSSMSTAVVWQYH
jgi:hypothetical protein